MDVNGGLKSLLNAQDQQSLDFIYAIGDKNIDGKLSKQEFKDMMVMFGQPVQDSQLNQFWIFLDTDMDGKISKQELATLIESSQGDQFPSVSLINKRQNGAIDADPSQFRVYTKTEKVNFLFQRYDTNKSGFFGFNEVKAFLIDLGYSSPSNNDVNWIISMLDTNRDSKISWAELYNGLQ